MLYSFVRMSLLKRISLVRRKRSRIFERTSGDAVLAPSYTSSSLEVSDQTNVHLIKLRIEPDSIETKAQSLLKARSIVDPVFIIGRRRGLVSKTPEDVDFSIRQVEPYTISKRHCLIERLVNSVIMRDLGGKYGFLVDGQRIGGRTNAPKSIELTKGSYNLVLGPRESTICFKLIVD